MLRTLEQLITRLASGVRRLAGGVSGALIASVQEELGRSERTERDARDLFDELPDPPHLEYGEVRYRNGRFKYLDG
jgi:hypothetical protein